MNGGVSRFENSTPLKTGAFTKSAMANDVASLKPPPPLIIDRFRGMLKEREAEFSVFNNGGHDSDTNLGTEEIVRLYEIVLSELTLNSKPIITDLTMIAGQQRAHAKGIANAICDRIIEVPVEQKLPSLYLLDSIVKNIGRDYVRHFSARLPEVFCEAYMQVHHSMRPAMRHLFGTWSTVFPSSVLRMIEAQLQFSPGINNQQPGLAPSKASESPRPTHGIHVNPEYLEARHQIDHSTIDTVGAKGLSSSGRACPGRTTSPSHQSLDAFGVDSYRRVAETASPSNSRFEYGLNRVTGKEEETNKLRAKNWHGESGQRLKNPAVLNKGVDLQGPRALIDAYGIDHREKKLNLKHIKVEQMGINGFDQTTASRTWQNTEEEEFDWEDMSPTLAHQSKDRFATQRAASLVTNFRSNSLSAQFSSTSDSSIFEGVRPVSSSHGGISKITGSHRASNQIAASSYIQESWNLPYQPSQHYLNAKEGSLHSGIGAFSTADEQKPPTIGNFSSVDGQFFGSHSVVDSLAPEIRSADASGLTKVWHPARLQNSYPLPSHSALPPEMHSRSQFPISVNISKSIPYEQHLDKTGMSISNLPRAPSQFSRPVVHPHLLPPRNNGYAAQGRGPPIGIALSNLDPVVQSSLPIINAPNTSFHLPGTAIPSLPRGPPHGTTQSIPPGNNVQVAPNPPAQGALSGLISSLVAQGLISLTKQDSVGVEFDQDLLKVRHESAITALYTDLPRQCKTCGLRFKSQEEHSKHMDWHVNKNRTLRTRKLKPSPKWFVSVSMWLSGAEAVGTEAVPGFLPADDVEMKEDEEMAVPADEDQNACALCGEPFDDFYSDEMDEWMYRGAVYMNSQAGSTAGMDRSQLGPIVHAKCRSESNAPTEHFTKDEEFYLQELSEEGRQRKRMRS
ncbi:polyadenylation and cleavage factor homolog 4 isoform X1 [Olea europaea subsp. europaea]|uniref:Polyadenylation and cleavage factor homolog 4 isoform X1 n=1 Tax=Olea europaea subsp. europaea TaxID=158383 RepID=A0A8S0TZX7_OLEEU|nr:polyadenylation and cleavage factor homolog 4 isoform X1 [Olea europaea subsp. europaea]